MEKEKPIKRVKLTQQERNKLSKINNGFDARRLAAEHFGLVYETYSNVLNRGYGNSETITKIRAKIN